MSTVKVELVCKAESVVVAEIETSGELTAREIRSGYNALDQIRAPGGRQIEDGVQMACQRCHEALWFRGADGELFAAMPSSVKVQDGA